MTVSRKVDYVADSKSVGGRFESFAAHHFRAPSSRPTPSTARPRRVGRSCAPSAGSAFSCRRRGGGVRPGSPRRQGDERGRGGEAVEAGGAGGCPWNRNFLWISPARSITWRRTEFWRMTGSESAPELTCHRKMMVLRQKVGWRPSNVWRHPRNRSRTRVAPCRGTRQGSWCNRYSCACPLK